MANAYTGAMYGSAGGPLGVAGGSYFGSQSNSGMNWKGQNSTIPGFAENGTWWDPAGMFQGPKAKPSLPNYADPMRPGYNTVYDENTMALAPEAYGLTANILPDSRGMDKYRGEALRSGPSTWSGLARNQLSGDEAVQRDALNANAASSAAGARSQVAMRGGLSGGASERLAASSNRDAMMANQGLAAHALGSRNQIATTDEANRIKMLRDLPEMEINQLRPRQWSAEQQLSARRGDIQNQIGENKSINDFNMAQWIQEQQRIQSRRNADVTLATAPKDKGFFGNIMNGLF